MKFKLMFAFIVICFLISAVAAIDTDVTGDDFGNALIHEENLLSIGNDASYQINSSPETESIPNPNDFNIIDSNQNDVNTTINSTDSSISTLKNRGDLYGIVDFGSNFMSLSIMEYDNYTINYILTKSEPSVTATFTENNLLTQAGIDELISDLKDFDEEMKLNNVTKRYYFATASLRKIENSDEVLATLKDRLNVTLNIITGEEEANIGFDAVKNTDFKTDEGILIDLGGGSCEIITFLNKTPVVMESIPIGSSSCFKEYVKSMFPDVDEKIEIENRVKKELDKLNILNVTYTDLYGMGGTIGTIRNILIHIGEIDNNTYEINTSKLDSLLKNMMENYNETYELISAVEPGRINTLLPGTIILQKISDIFNVEMLHFCKSRLEEGIVYRLLEQPAQNESKTNDSAVNITTDDTSIINAVKYSIKNKQLDDGYDEKMLSEETLDNTPTDNVANTTQTSYESIGNILGIDDSYFSTGLLIMALLSVLIVSTIITKRK